MKNLDIQIESWPLDRLELSDANPRTHTAEQVAQIAASIQELGFVNPILVGADGKIIAGEGRFRAAQKLGLRKVPVIQLRHLSGIQRRALAIADNQLALKDEEMLRQQLATLKNEKFNLNILGFDDMELARQLADQDEGWITDEDEVPATPIASVTSPATSGYWNLGKGASTGYCAATLLVGETPNGC